MNLKRDDGILRIEQKSLLRPVFGLFLVGLSTVVIYIAITLFLRDSDHLTNAGILITGLAILSHGIWLVAAFPTIVWTFDSKQKIAKLRRSFLFWSTVKQIEFRAISKVLIDSTIAYSRDCEDKFRAVVELRDGSRLRVSRWYLNRTKVETVVAEIRKTVK